MERHEDARRWARPGTDGAPERGPERGRDGVGEVDAPEQPLPSAASPWTRGLRPTRMPDDASGVRAPALPWEDPPAASDEGDREPRMWPIAAGITGLAVLACIPHWVAPTIALMVSLVGIPIAWGFRRISHGRRRVQYIVVVLTLLLTVALAVIAPVLWLQLDVLQPLTVPS